MDVTRECSQKADHKGQDQDTGSYLHKKKRNTKKKKIMQGGKSKKTQHTGIEGNCREPLEVHTATLRNMKKKVPALAGNKAAGPLICVETGRGKNDDSRVVLRGLRDDRGDGGPDT